MRISDWSSDVCSSDLLPLRKPDVVDVGESDAHRLADGDTFGVGAHDLGGDANAGSTVDVDHGQGEWNGHVGRPGLVVDGVAVDCPCSRNWFEFNRSEEHTSELQSLMRISYAVFCLKN